MKYRSVYFNPEPWIMGSEIEIAKLHLSSDNSISVEIIENSDLELSREQLAVLRMGKEDILECNDFYCLPISMGPHFYLDKVETCD